MIRLVLLTEIIPMWYLKRRVRKHPLRTKNSLNFGFVKPQGI